MSHPVDVHPEDLLDDEQHRSLTHEERRRLDSHTMKCASCALIRVTTHDFAHERASHPGDELLMERCIARAIDPYARFAPPRRSRRARRSPWAVAAVVMFAATAATASFWSVERALATRVDAPTPEPSPESAKPAASRKAKRHSVEHPAALEAPAPAQDPSLAGPSEIKELLPTNPAPRAALPPREPTSRAPSRAKLVEEVAFSAEQLFQLANEARRRGDASQAIKLYRDLQQHFQGSREERTSRVLLGRLWLDRGESTSAALSLFTRYLVESPNGTLAEEARLGRALSLMKLGQSDERQAWQDLLAAHPGSIHAERARKRLDELR